MQLVVIVVGQILATLGTFLGGQNLCKIYATGMGFGGSAQGSTKSEGLSKKVVW